MTEADNQASKYVSTGIAGLDEVLRGGFLRKGFYLLQGDPGSGKTTIALQYLFAGSLRGEKGLYITLTESQKDLENTCRAHGWDLTTIQVDDLTQSHVNTSAEQDNTVFYPSEIELVEITRHILAEVERVRPQHVVFDGVSELRLLSVEPLRYRHQMLALKHFFDAQGITVLLLDDRTNASKDIPAESLVGGNIILERFNPAYGGARRRLQVTKVRSAGFRDGYHDYEITDTGVVVYPRLTVSSHSDLLKMETFSSDLPALDRMLDGGLCSGATALLLGPSGTGKSTIAMQYVAAALERGEKAAVYTFDETLAILFARSEKLCKRGIRQYQESGQLYARQVDPAELSPGGFAHEVKRAVEQEGARVVVIDTMNGYLNAMPEERFLTTHLHELFAYLNQQHVVTIAVAVQHGLVKMEQSQIDLSYLADIVLLFRHFEAQGQILKALSVFKNRVGGHERTIRQLSITAEGIQVGEPLEAFHGVMTGVPEYTGKTNLTLDGKG
jgi:circadian clock protein KaiC